MRILTIEKEVGDDKKSVALATLMSFLVFSWSCAIYSWKKTPLQSVEPEKRAEVKVSAVQTKSGEIIEFCKKPPARIEANSVVGETAINDIVVEKSEIKTPKDLPAFPPFNFSITTTDGRIYRVTDYREKNDVIIFQGYLPFSIALSDIDLIWVKKFNALATLLVDIILPVGILFAIIAKNWQGHVM